MGPVLPSAPGIPRLPGAPYRRHTETVDTLFWICMDTTPHSRNGGLVLTRAPRLPEGPVAPSSPVGPLLPSSP